MAFKYPALAMNTNIKFFTYMIMKMEKSKPRIITNNTKEYKSKNHNNMGIYTCIKHTNINKPEQTNTTFYLFSLTEKGRGWGRETLINERILNQRERQKP